MPDQQDILGKAGHVRYCGRPVPLYEFRHLTFQEYLAGLALVDGRFPERDRSLSLAENVAPLAGRVVEPDPPKDGSSELGISENWSEALRLCIATCNDDDVDSALLAIFNPLDNEDINITRRPRVILAALSLADEPNASEDIGLKVLQEFVKQVSEKDGTGPIKTGVDVAAKELGTSIWASALRNLLVAEFINRDTVSRTSVGGLCGMVTALSAPVDVTEFNTWLSEQIAQLSSENQSAAIDAALTIMDIAYRGKAKPIPGITSALINMLRESVPMAHAASWALLWLNNENLKDNRLHLASESEQIISLIDDPNIDNAVIRYLIIILGRERVQQAVAILVKKLKDKDEDIRISAIVALRRIGDIQALNPLIAGVDGSSAKVRAEIAGALGGIKDLRALNPLFNLLKDEDEKVRARAMDALKDFDDDRVIKALISGLDDQSDLVKVVASILLGQKKNIQAVEPLITKLEDSSLSVQREVIEALGLIGDHRALLYLVKKIQHQDPTIRIATLNALSHLLDTKVIELIFDRLKDESIEVRTIAEHILLKEAIKELELGNIENCIQIFNRIIAAIPQDDYKNDLAYCLIISGQYKEAASQLDSIDFSLAYNAPLYLHNRGIVSYLEGAVEKGIQQLKESLSRVTIETDYDPRDVFCMLLLAGPEAVSSVKGIPIDAAALLNLYTMGGLTKEETIAELSHRYPDESKDWLNPIA